MFFFPKKMRRIQKSCAAAAAAIGISAMGAALAQQASAQQSGLDVEPGVGIAHSGAHADLLKGDARPALSPGVSVAGPVTVTITRPDGTTKRYVGAQDLTYFAARDTLNRANKMITFEGAVVFKIINSAGVADTVSMDQGTVTVTSGSATDL